MSTTTRLEELAAEIKKEHQQGEIAAAYAIECFCRAGEELIEAKALVRRERGQWQSWVKGNLPLDKRQIQRYAIILIGNRLVRDPFFAP
jgi:hypothetical protein